MSCWKRFVIEMGMGVDQHGQDPTSACIKALKDAISRVYLIGILDLSFKSTKIQAKFAVPHSSQVDIDRLKKAFPLKEDVSVEVVEGGLAFEGAVMKEFGDRNAEVLIANAAISVYVLEDL